MLAIARVWLLVAGAAVALIAAIAALPTGEAPAERPPHFTFIPLAGVPIDYVVEDAQASGAPCLPFLVPILERPSWQLQIVEGGTSCLGEVISASLEIDHTGLAAWMEPGMPERRTWLTPDELHAIAGLDRLNCASD